MLIRAARDDDAPAIWEVLRPVIRAGESYALDRGLDEAAALGYWRAPGHRCFVVEADGAILGTYYLRANQAGGGNHVGNCGYITAHATRGQGVARRMCEHSLDEARAIGFRAMQFNLVVGTNTGAIHLWQSLGFAIVGRLPDAFLHPSRGYVDALVMFRAL